MFARYLLVVLSAASFGQVQDNLQNTIQNRGMIMEPRARRPISSADVPHGFGLVIGIGGYANLPPTKRLRYSEHDAETIYNALIDPTGGNFKPEEIRKLIGPDATLASIKNALEVWLPSKAREGDRVIIYFAGHGFLNESGRAYLAPYDVDLDRLEETAYPTDEFAKTVGTKIKARWKVLFADACHSGAITPDMMERVNDTLQSFRAESPDLNILAFAASRKRESSFEDKDLQAGIFTYFLARAFRGDADRNRDGAVTADELIDYVRSHVHEHAAKYGEQQTPVENQEFDPDLILAFDPSRAGGSAHTPADERPLNREGTLTVETNQDGAEFFLDGTGRGSVSRDRPLFIPAIPPGWHEVRGTRNGYSDDGPRKINIGPGQDARVKLRFVFPVTRTRAAAKLFEDGLKAYNRGTEADCRSAVKLFQESLTKDPSYGEAAMYLGRAHQTLYETDKGLAALRRAVQLAPDSVECRLSYASVLLDTGNTDEAIRQLRYAQERAPDSSEVHAHMAQAFRITEEYVTAADEAIQAIRLDPNNGQARLWLGDSLRAQKKFDQALNVYLEGLKLMLSVDSTAARKIGYMSGFILPSVVNPLAWKKRGSQEWIHRDQLNLLYFGLCNCEEMLENYNQAGKYCSKALEYDPADPYSYFELALIELRKYLNVNPSPDLLLHARANCQKMLKINPDLELSAKCRSNLRGIDEALSQKTGAANRVRDGN